MPRHTGRILGSYLRNPFASLRHSEFLSRRTRYGNILSSTFLRLMEYSISSGWCTIVNNILTPDGSTWWVICNSKMYVDWLKFFGFSLYCLVIFFLLPYFIWCATSAPNGSSPRGYIWVFALGCRLNFWYLINSIFPSPLLRLIKSIFNTADKSSLRAYGRVFATGHRLPIFYFWLYICWSYAWEAIIKQLLLYFNVHDKCLHSML
jgi:hypothetical protein